MKERLTLLQQTKVISDEACQATEIAIGLISQHLAITPDNAQFQMAMTHFARAYDRIKNGITVAEGLDPDILDEILTDDTYEPIQALNEAIILQTGLIDVPASENSFFISNLFAIYHACLAKEEAC
ncbi:hypothetical protein LRP52_00915 [Photobacterium sp. ZSDE20]|uniref:PRD domain-containing protein n=1 Tax=Photobacterium pectinilyticum TaxID=2906793 RepID=A0ABT1MVV2_9GAMM|nr:hypothetical protein [Photobacterium sp. ZSDE20]MCQ1056626.1 hypothetical protein [Photobacterium sp. ZSDE20]MDD1820761.1 hypothetical protein [Photobacterium sp. ZSDE20]